MREAVRALSAFGLAATVGAAGAVWWVHESATQVVATIVLLLAASVVTDVGRWSWWKHLAKRRASQEESPI